jgi:FAD synthetase
MPRPYPWYYRFTMRILTFGTFDDLHPGHLSYLSQAQALGDLFVVVARDANVWRIKGRAPLETQETRVQKVQEAFPQATVVLGSDGKDFLQPLRDLKPDLLFLGYDQKLPPNVSENDLPCPVRRAEAFEPHIHKSSLRRKE